MMENTERLQAMTLEEFVSGLERELSDFKQMWVDENKLSPDEFPLEMNEGEWYEQWIAHIN